MKKPTSIHRGDEVVQRVAQLRTLLGMIEAAAAARDCPSKREAVERFGESGCPLCGAPAVLHRGELS